MALTNVLVICHGRNHRVIKEIDWPNSVLVDIEPDNNPDHCLDVASSSFPRRIKALTHPNGFDHVINAFCPISTEFQGRKSVLKNYETFVVDGPLNPKLFLNMHEVISPDGRFYSRCPFHLYEPENPWDPDDDPIPVKNPCLFIDKMYAFGFVYETTTTLTFNKTAIDDFIVFRKIPLPTLQQRVNFLINRLDKEPKVKFATILVYDLEQDFHTHYIAYNDGRLESLLSPSKWSEVQAITFTLMDDRSVFLL